MNVYDPNNTVLANEFLINEEVMAKIITDLQSGVQSLKQVNIYSARALVMLRYLDLCAPQFSKAGAASQILVQEVKNEYPDLWKAVSEHEDIPENKSQTTLPTKYPVINIELWKTALKEASVREGRLITIYNQRLSAVFRYLMVTTPRFKMSSNAASLIERGLSTRYPKIWRKLLKDLK